MKQNEYCDQRYNAEESIIDASPKDSEGKQTISGGSDIKFMMGMQSTCSFCDQGNDIAHNVTRRGEKEELGIILKSNKIIHYS